MATNIFDLYMGRQWKRRIGLGRNKLKLWSSLAMAGFVGFLGLVLFTGILFAWYAKDLPRPDRVRRVEGLSTVVVDRNGESLYDIYQDENRIPVNWVDVPQHLKYATVAIEDKDFYRHQGLSTAGIMRALVSTLVFRRVQGGSTLTQQLVKNVLLTKERTLARKFKEAVLSIQIERRYSKDEILNMYLNEAPYGGTAVGVVAAAQDYFDKEVKDLTLVESAILAGLPQSPSRYSPFTGEPKAYVARAQHVLRRMREDGYITPVEEAEARKQLDKVQFASPDAGLRAPHFVAYVKELLEEKLGSKVVAAGGLKVTTTLNWKLQEAAQKIVKEEVDKAKGLRVSNGAAVVIDPRAGEILAMVGSKDYAATDAAGLKFNVVTQGLRQPGSAIKPITYATAFKKGYTAATLLLDVDTKYPSGDPKKPEYNPKNYDNKFRGPIQLRYALGNSINTIAVKVTALVGIREVLRTAYDMGIHSLEPTDENLKRLGLSITLGGGEVTLLDLSSAFGVFAAGGFRQDPVAILKVEDSRGKVLFEHKPVSPRRVLSEDVAYLISHILSDNEARKEVFGLRSYLHVPGRTVAVKTGTTDDKRDNWAVGYTTFAVVGAWVGNNDNSPMHPSLASGATGASPIWNRLMREVMKSQADEPFPRPETVVELDIDAYGGGLPVSGQPIRKEIFIRGTEPTGSATIYQTLKLSRKDNNKLANPVEIATGDYDERSFIVFHEDDPVSTDGKNRWQEAIDAWLTAQSDSQYHPPREVYQGGDRQITVSIKSPSDLSQVDNNEVKVKADIAAINDVAKVEIFVDGSLKKETSGKSIEEKITIVNGSHTVRVKATDNKGNSAEADVRVGINQPYAAPTTVPSPTPALSPTP